MFGEQRLVGHLAAVRPHPRAGMARQHMEMQMEHGLAGLRVGYAIGHPDVIASIDKTLFPFAVNGLAQAAAIAAIQLFAISGGPQ